MEAFHAAERQSPGFAALHLAAGCAWCFSLSIGAGVEAACFALLLGTATLRARDTVRLYPRLLCTAVCAFYAAWVAWQMCSNLWSVVPVEDWVDALALRRPLALLALWPLAARWRSLLVALCAGALLGAVATGVAVAWHGRLGLEARDLVIAKYRSSAGPLAAVGIATAVAAMFWVRNWAAWFGCLVAAGFFALQVCALAGRGPALAAAVGVAVVLVRVPKWPGAIARRYTFGALAIGVVLAGIVLGGPLLDRFSQVRVSDEDGVDLSASNIRMVLWEEAWERGWNRPIIGHGAHAWRGSVGAEIAADPAHFGVGTSQSERLSQGNHAHNTVLGAWYGTGAVGVFLLCATFAAIVVSLWRAAPLGWAQAAALGMAFVYITDGMFDDLGNVSVGGFLVAMLVLFASVNARARCRPSRA